jgi:hypothetical protein
MSQHLFNCSGAYWWSGVERVEWSEVEWSSSKHTLSCNQTCNCRNVKQPKKILVTKTLATEKSIELYF